MRLLKFLALRILAALPVLIGVATLTFLLLHTIPGDPVDLMLGENASSLDKEALRRDLGLDRPLINQYSSFMLSASQLDFGKSLSSRLPVRELIFDRLPATAELALGSMILALLIGVPLGVLAAVRRNSAFDQLLRGWTLIGNSTPSFWLGPMLILIFALKLDWLPVSERGSLQNLILPALTLSIGLSSVLLQITRGSMIEVLNEDYLRTARAKGASFFRLWFKHALRNALMPVITVAGLQFGAVLTGTVIVETVFDWPGIGTLLFQAIQQRDYPLVQGCVLVVASIYVLVNLLTDVAYAAANPRIRFT